MLEDMIQVDEDVDDILLEDEFMYAIGGTLDVGELVSQLFWLELGTFYKQPSILYYIQQSMQPYRLCSLTMQFSSTQT